jgi:hypothetical protein
MLDIKAKFNNMKASVVHHESQDGKFCTYGCEAICVNLGHGTPIDKIVSCQATKHIYHSTFDLWSNLLCPK